MKADKVLEIVLREMTAYGIAYRTDWSEFDGRTLRDQLDDIEKWAKKALDSNDEIGYTEGTDFLKETEDY